MRADTEGNFNRIGPHTRDLDSGDGRNAQIAFTLGTLASGTYYLPVTSQLDTTGTYRLSVRVLHPGKPTNLSATANGSMQIDLSWDAPVDYGGSAITGYKIEVSTTGGTRWTVLVPDTGNDDTEYSHTGLSPGDTRTYRVSAINVHGTSEASDSDYATTPVEVTLHLSETSTLENNPAVTATATAWPPSPVAFTVTVSASPVAPATAGDFELSTNRVLSFARNATESTGTVTIRMVDDDEREPDDVVTVSGAVSDAAIPDPDDVTLTILNDDAGPPPTVTSVAVASAPQSGNTYHWGETVVFTATFNEPVRVTGRPGLDVGLDEPAGTSGSTVQARFAGLSENGETGPGARPASVSRYVHFAYTVQPFDRDADGVRIGADALRLASGDVIRSDETGARAELAHAAPGRLTGHRVDGRTTVDGEPAAPAEGAGIRFVDRDGNPLRTLANGRHRLTVPEGGSARYGLRLETRPAHAVVVSHHYAYEGDPDLAVPRDLMGDRSIAPDEWNTRTVWVEVEAAQDFDAEDGERVFENRAASNDPSYHDLALPDVVAVEADDDAPTCRLDPGDVWCGVITVGEAEAGFYGYHRFFGYGDLSDDDFVVGTNRYSVQTLIVAGQKGIESDGNLTFELSERPDAAGQAALDELTLHLDSDRFRLSDAEPDRPGRYYWVDAGMNWSGEEYVIARLRRDSSSSGGRALQGRFISPPERHDGAKRVKVRVGFSEPIDESPENVGEHGVEVEGGEVTSVRAVGGNAPGGSAARSTTRSLGGRNAGQQDREVVWEFEIEPDSDDDVTVSLEAGRPCGETGAICTADGRALSAGISTTVRGPDEGPAPLTGAFEDMPEAHDGESGFRFRVAFSEDIGISYRSLREDAFAVTGGRVTRGARVDDRRDLFEMTVEPDGGGAVTIELPAGRECGVSGAICTTGENRRQLTNSPSATVAGPPDERRTNTAATGAPAIGGTPRVGETLTVSTLGISDADGLDDARFAHQWMRADADIPGATGPTYTAVAADEGRRLKVRVGFTDDAGNAESLTSAATDAVAARSAPLTASFEGMPAGHRGEGGFHFRVAFSEDIGISSRSLREDAFAVTGGRVTGGKRVDGRRDLFRMTVRPDSDAAVTVTLPAGRECGVSGAICTKSEPRRQLTNSPSARVRGPVGISVADARVEEEDGAVLVFLVTLSRAAGGTLAVDYVTEDGSAHAGVDYTAASGRLSFRTGESSKKIEVGVLDDAHDEGEETLTLRLSNASSGRLTDGDATGTIENRDPLPRALLARFGRTAAVHVVEHVEERLQAPREPGFRGRFAGRELRRGMERDMALNFLSQLGSASGVHPAGMAGHGPMAGSPAAGAGPLGMPGRGGGGPLMTGAGGPMSGAVGMAGGGASLHAPGLGATGFGGAAPMGAGPAGGPPGPAGGLNDGGFLQMGLGGGDLLTGSDFAMNRESRGGILSFWSRGAQSRFSGREGALSLGGDVRTTMFGADYARGPVVAGLSLSNSRGLGHYAGAAGGQVASSVTGLYPWLGYKATERVTVWGVAGYGTGGLLLTPDGGQALESGLSMAMAAAGTRGELVAGGASGFELAFKADALWVGTAIDGVDGPAGRLKATDAAVTRFRTGLEGSRGYTLAGRLSLTPSVEAGLRHDGGDAETGAGMDVGAGLVVSDAGTGLAVDVRVRTLLVHQDEDFSERGVSLSLSYNPTPSTPLGFVARVAPSWGGQATSGAQALWGRETMAGMAHGGVAQGNRLDGEVGYGLPVGRRFVGTPRIGFSTSEYGQDYRVGYGLGVLDRESLAFELGVEAQRRNSPLLGGTSNGMLGRATLGW